MIIKKILHIDIRVHFGYSQDGHLQDVNNNFLRRAKRELFEGAIHEGIFDSNNSHYRIRFKEVPYSEPDMIYAKDWLIDHYMDESKRNLVYAVAQANREYKKLKPFNLEMIIEVNDDR